MADIIKQYLSSIDNADNYSDDLILKLEQKALEDIDDLFINTENRDEELWDEFDADIDVVVDDYDVEPEDDRDLNWVMGLAGLSAAASTQFFLDERDETVIKPLAYREQLLDPFALTRQQLIEAGKRSVEIIAEPKFKQLQSKYLKELSFFKDMSNKELFEALRDYDAIRPAQQLIADASGYVSRMTAYRPGSPQFKETVADLVDMNSKRGLKMHNRRAVERIYSYRQADGDMNQLMVWIGEADAKACSYCLERFGMMRTYREWINEGLPGADVCKGGDYCRCHLAAA